MVHAIQLHLEAIRHSSHIPNKTKTSQLAAKFPWVPERTGLGQLETDRLIVRSKNKHEVCKQHVAEPWAWLSLQSNDMQYHTSCFSGDPKLSPTVEADWHNGAAASNI